MSLLEVTDLTVSWPGAPEPAVDGVGFSVERGESVGIVGESGSGKTQTALALMGLTQADARLSGRILFDGFDLVGRDAAILNRFRARRIAMVFQDPHQALNPYIKIGDQLRRVLLEHGMARGDDARLRALEMLRRVRLPDVERQYRSYPHQLSGGMRQRAMIALALCCEPELLLADEPTTALDVTVQAQILALLQELRAQAGIALLLITHDLGVIAENCERMLVLHRGRLVEHGATLDVFANPTQKVTKTMLAAAAKPGDAAPAGPEKPGARVLSVRNLVVTFRNAARGRRLSAVRDVSFDLTAAETLAVVGESGCGKTTLARAIVGLVAPDSGSVLLGGTQLAPHLQKRDVAARRHLQMVFQDPVASLDPAMRIGGIIAEPISLHGKSLSRAAIDKRVISTLARVGLDESLLQRYPHEVSGGQAQRVAIARALVLEPEVLICDEAVAALDGTARRSVLELLRAEQLRSGLAIIFITHDLAVVRQVSHRVLVMYMGRICELADNEELFRQPQHPYTRALMDAIPVADPTLRRPPPSIIGETRTGGIPAGCAFHPRCEYAIPRCSEEVPESRQSAGVEVACHRAGEIDVPL